MFELHLGDKLSVPSTVFNDPVFLTGRPGQGRSTTFLKVAFELIKNRQSGVILDPYGDLAKTIKEKTSNTQYTDNLIFCDLEITKPQLKSALVQKKIGVKETDDQYIDRSPKNTAPSQKIVVVSASRLIDGERQTREKGIKFLKNYFKLIGTVKTTGQNTTSQVSEQTSTSRWLLIDEAFSFVDAEIIKKYLEVKKIGLNVLFSDQGISKLSAWEREKIGKLIGTFIIYKPSNFDAICLSEINPKLNPKNIAAIQQFHFQFLQNDPDGQQKLTYHAGVWPVELK